MTEKVRIPQIRFKGFTAPWEQRKFKELVEIERGGSPRPIEEFITNDKNGLNWVKIGDAPDQGNYITKTAEKIKPSGLSKTREVHPGDLILSNSPFGYFAVPLKNKCSRKCATPEFASVSFIEPVRTQVSIVTIGLLWFS